MAEIPELSQEGVDHQIKEAREHAVWMAIKLTEAQAVLRFWESKKKIA